ncbi:MULTISPECIES: SCO family protein [unclassified Endozoicomonas]|uniref:SCO family protein n=1 Tax=unclassified Endozoicomonas TaxID=2644528 RepID=UPI003BB7F7E2
MKRVKKTKSRWQLALVILMPSLAMGLAWYFYFFGTQFVPDGRTNKGELLLPPASFQSMTLEKNNEMFDLQGLEGRWGVLVFGDDACSDQACQEALYQTRQAHLALGRDSDRVVRLFISSSSNPELNKRLLSEHPDLIWLGSRKESVLNALGKNPGEKREWPTNGFYIVDPLGNIMMKYQPGQYGGDLLKDLRKLLKASNIG